MVSSLIMIHHTYAIPLPLFSTVLHPNDALLTALLSKRASEPAVASNDCDDIERYVLSALIQVYKTRKRKKWFVFIVKKSLAHELLSRENQSASSTIWYLKDRETNSGYSEIVSRESVLSPSSALPCPNQSAKQPKTIAAQI